MKKFRFQNTTVYLNCFPCQQPAVQAQIGDQRVFGILNPPMLTRHQTGGGHKQLPDVQNAELYEGYSILIPHPDKRSIDF